MSVPSSPVPSQKRAGTEMVPPDRTPKRAKTIPSTSAAVSPSIKQWLKRSASDSPTSKDEVKNKKSKLSKSESNSTTSAVYKGDRSVDSESSGKVREKTDTSSGPVSRTQEVQNQRIVRRIACKRKLDDSCSDENTSERPSKRLNIHGSPTKDMAKSPEKENSGARSVEADSDNLKSNKLKNSPTKQSTPFKDLKSDINSSPDKRVQEGQLEFYSPARPRKFDIDAKTLASPTTNLPNSVLDSPSNAKKIFNKENDDKKPTVDWLTQLRMQKTKKNTSTKACSRKLSDKYGQSSESVTPSKELQPAQENSEEMLKCKVSSGRVNR